VLQTEHNRSLAAVVELFLVSPLFEALCPDSRALLGVVASLPQGISGNNLGWLFPTIPNGKSIFHEFCILGFTATLAPLRDYLPPKVPKLSLLLCVTKDYFIRMLVKSDSNELDLEETWWITSEDISAEHLLDVSSAISVTL